MLNEYYQNVGIMGYFKRYGIYNAILRGVFNANPFHYIKDYEIKKILWQKRASKKIRKYLKFKEFSPEGFIFGEHELNNPIWIYWNSGLENAPELVKRCFESVVKYAKQPVIFLSENNVNEYVILPEYIVKKVGEGKIPIAGYTDLMRFALLEHYGGTWIDSTVLLTDTIPDRIMNCDFFAFRNALGLLDNPVLFPAWFTHANKGNKTIKEVRNVAFAYWTREQHVIEYLLPNLIITEVLKEDNEALGKIPYMDSEYSERLIRVIGDKYTSEEAEWLKHLTCIHKLTYKLDESVNKEDSIYRAIINNIF